jgi:hypothetical protein
MDLKMKKNKLSLNIETLVLAAIWDHPFIFQGSFTITHTKSHANQLLFFRCECCLESKMDIFDIAFSPYDYTFTHLYDGKSEIHLANTDDDLEQALYLLKYSLSETLKKMIPNTNQRLVQMDEIAMSSIAQQIKDHMICHGQKKMDNDNVGFAVSILFTPTESMGRRAARALLMISKSSELKNSLH